MLTKHKLLIFGGGGLICLVVVVGLIIFQSTQAGSSSLLQAGSTKTALVKANWCKHCRKMIPQMQKLARKYPSKYIIIDGPQKGKQWLSKNNVKAYPAVAQYNSQNDTVSNIKYGYQSLQ